MAIAEVLDEIDYKSVPVPRHKGITIKEKIVTPLEEVKYVNQLSIMV